MNAYPFLTWIAPRIMLPQRYEVAVDPETRRPYAPQGENCAQTAAEEGTEDEVSVGRVAFPTLVAVASILALATAR